MGRHAAALIASAIAVGVGALASGAVHAQGALKPVDARIVNTPSQPVPVTGTVKLDGGVGAITGTLKSGDKTVTILDTTIPVDDSFFGNHTTSLLDVADYKEVRIAVSNGTCGPCGEVVAAVFVNTANGGSYQIDQFTVNLASAGVGHFNSKTYTVPGSKLSVSLRATTPGTSNSVRVAVLGRTN